MRKLLHLCSVCLYQRRVLQFALKYPCDPPAVARVPSRVHFLPAIMTTSFGLSSRKRSWLAALEKRHGKCPFTNVKISHRGLILLTCDNIAEHRDNIRNWYAVSALCPTEEGPRSSPS